MQHLKKNKIISQYLIKHLPEYQVFSMPSKHLEMVVVIPVYREKKFIFRTLESLCLCDKPESDVEVILLFNAMENCPEKILDEQKSTAELIRKEFCQQSKWLTFIVVEKYNIPKKHFGAGMARKAGMDIALAKLFGANNCDGIIVSLDADTLVLPNYFKAISDWFKNPEKNGASIYFEHPLDGEEFTPDVYNGIIKYELHLRYFVQTLRYTCFPYAFHTLGSAMAIRSSAYSRIGGMPRKQAGEDFYFLQKLIPLGDFGEINNTTIIPSPRPSDRVIFGTGAAISNHLKGNGNTNLTYNYDAFKDLRHFFLIREKFYNVNKYENLSKEIAIPLKNFLLDSNFFSDLEALKNNCASLEVFNKRFFEIFNAFKVVKYMNYVHEGYFNKVDVFDESLKFLRTNNYNVEGLKTERDVLEIFRKLDKKQLY